MLPPHPNRYKYTKKPTLSMQKTFTDQEIVDGIRSKNTPLLDAIVAYLYHQCQRSITRLVTSNSGSPADADDLFQDVIVAFLQNVWEDRFELRDGVMVTTYIHGIANRMWLKELRRGINRNDRNDKYGKQQHNDQTDTPTPEVEVIEQEELALSLTTFNRLDELCQQILTAFYFEKKTMKQIADEFGLGNEDNAKTRKYRCVQALKRLMNA
ncbi:RNA polymerase sigma factor [Spirosoma spitsbergense]|uniref:RNA polymerase sigma factor n=1 Tax=Spirosoma spitsbergense TaxID=431554 RepID=UPI0003A19C55|nr:sigma-70 family RNA polymerase sigma factor [Spirosoma spitsbergense]